jgi:hypothetical protein
MEILTILLALFSLVCLVCLIVLLKKYISLKFALLELKENVKNQNLTYGFNKKSYEYLLDVVRSL